MKNISELTPIIRIIVIVVSTYMATFMTVQAINDSQRRRYFLCFAVTWFYLPLLEILIFFNVLDPMTNPKQYELLRLFWGFGYIISLTGLFEVRNVYKKFLAPAILLSSLLLWYFNWMIATTVIYTIVFGIGALLHGQYFLKKRGYASVILCASSVALALLCTTFLYSMQKGTETLSLGYIHYAIISFLSVVFGWTHFPREIKEQIPVQMNIKHGIIFFSVIVLAEIAYTLDLFLSEEDNITSTYITAMLIQLFAFFVIYFFHRHNLVIYAANVTELLDERTKDLRDAQEKLAQYNEVLEEKVEDQSQEILSKAEVIERQRRLEMAARTAGQTSHDIQNNLTPILTIVDELLKSTQSPDKVKQLTTKIKSQTQGLFELNSQMLTLSRRGRIELSPINLKEIITSAADPHLGKDLHLINAEENIWINGSWHQLSRAMTNLIFNAFESYPNHNGPVTIRSCTKTLTQVQHCFLGVLEPKTYGMIEVNDNGSGIPNTILEKIFDPYFSSKSNYTSSGSGLGLSIVAAVVDDMNGVLDLKTSSEGTTFTLYFPTISDPGILQDEKDLGGNETIMVIDDDETILNRLEKIFKDSGYTVILSSSGPEAIKILQVESADLIFLDYEMPNMNGLATYYAILHIRPSCRVVIHSSFLTENDTNELAKLGAKNLLPKPASPLELLKTARNTLDN